MADGLGGDRWAPATARLAALVRAAEGERADGLLDDPLAAALVAADEPQRLEADRAALRPWAALARLFDERALAATRDDGLRQIVVVGAAGDTRAYRLDWPAGVRLFEVDGEEALPRQGELFAGAEPRCERIAVGATLDDWPERLVAAGYDAKQPAVFIAEGLLGGFEEAVRGPFFDALLKTAGYGSTVLYDTPSEALLKAGPSAPAATALAAAGVVWRSALDYPRAAMQRRNWRAEQLRLDEVAAEYGLEMADSGADDDGAVTAEPAYWVVVARRPYRPGSGAGGTTPAAGRAPGGTPGMPGLPGRPPGGMPLRSRPELGEAHVIGDPETGGRLPGEPRHSSPPAGGRPGEPRRNRPPAGPRPGDGRERSGGSHLLPPDRQPRDDQGEST